MRRTLLICLALGAATLAVYGRTLGFGFVNYDDPLYVTAEPRVQAGLTAPGVAWAFTDEHAGNFHPVTTLSHMLDVTLFGLAPWGHHLTNVLLHTANVVLVFLVLQTATGAPWPSAATAVLFALHPLHVESVAWIAQRKDVLSGFFGLLTIGAWVGWARRGGAGRYALVALLLALGLLAKPMLVTLPLVLLLLDHWPLDRLRDDPRRRVLEKIPLLVLAAGSSVATLLAQSARGAVMPVAGIPLDLRVANAIVSYVRYLRRTVWPTGLAVLHQHPNLPGGQPWHPIEVASAAGLLLAITALVWMSRRPWALVGWLWFVGMLVPVIGLLQVGAQAMADRYTYLPLVGIFIIAAWSTAEAVARRPTLRQPVAAATMLVLVGMAAASARQVGHWRDSAALWSHVLATTAPRSPVAHYNLGQVLLTRGQAKAAATHFRAALAESPTYVVALVGLGIALQTEGRYEEAIARYERALALQPGYVPAWNSLGLAYQETGRQADAERAFREALRRDPNHAKAHANLAATLQALGRNAEAVEHYRRALALVPADLRSQNNLGMALRALGRSDEAIDAFRAAIRLAPGYATAHNNLGIVLQESGRLPDAVASYREALRHAPDYANAHSNLGAALLALGRPAEAVEHLETAVRLAPDSPAARANLASARAALTARAGGGTLRTSP